MFKQDSILTSPKCCFKFSNNNPTDVIADKHFNNSNDNDNLISDNSLEVCSNKMSRNILEINDFCLTPLKSTENLLSPFSTTKNINDSNLFDANLSLSSIFTSSPFNPINTSTVSKTYSPEDRKPTKISVNLCNKFETFPNKELNNIKNTTYTKDTIDPNLFPSPIKDGESSNLEHEHDWTAVIKSKYIKLFITNFEMY